MMTKCKFYVDGERKATAKFNLNMVEKEWTSGDCYGLIGESFKFVMNNPLWLHRTEHSIIAVNTEGSVLYWRIVGA